MESFKWNLLNTKRHFPLLLRYYSNIVDLENNRSTRSILVKEQATLESFLDYIDCEVEYAWGHVGSRHELEWSYCGTKRCLILDFRYKFAWSGSPCTSKPRRVSVPAASGLYRAIFPCYCCVPRKSPVSVKSLSSQFLSSTLTSSPPEPHQGYK